MLRSPRAAWVREEAPPKCCTPTGWWRIYFSPSNTKKQPGSMTLEEVGGGGGERKERTRTFASRPTSSVKKGKLDSCFGILFCWEASLYGSAYIPFGNNSVLWPTAYQTACLVLGLDFPCIPTAPHRAGTIKPGAFPCRR